MKTISSTLCALMLATSLYGAVQTIMPPETPSSIATTGEMSVSQEPSVRSSMIIDPKQRAQDFQQAYDMLKKEKTAGKVYFQFSDGSSIGNIIAMTTMANGTIVLFRYNSSQGIKFQIVKIEDILTLQY